MHSRTKMVTPLPIGSSVISLPSRPMTGIESGITSALADTRTVLVTGAKRRRHSLTTASR